MSLLFSKEKKVDFQDLIDPIPRHEDLPYLDTEFSETATGLSAEQKSWQKTGVVHMPGVIPWDLIDAYCELRKGVSQLTGWKSNTPYMHHRILRDLGLYKPVILQMEDLIGDRMGMHLNLTGWVSTERNWHQDEYLNPPFINSWYCAAWFALEDINPDSGPFQYVPGSHRWGIMRQEKTLKHLTEKERSDPNWPKIAERFVDDACEEEIKKRKAEIVTYVPKKGDVLLWHSRLMHRGSKPNKNGIMRKAFIAHYSALSAREDMPLRKEHDNGCYYFVFHDTPNQ